MAGCGGPGAGHILGGDGGECGALRQQERCGAGRGGVEMGPGSVGRGCRFSLCWREACTKPQVVPSHARQPCNARQSSDPGNAARQKQPSVARLSSHSDLALQVPSARRGRPLQRGTLNRPSSPAVTSSGLDGQASTEPGLSASNRCWYSFVHGPNPPFGLTLCYERLAPFEGSFRE